MGSRNYAGRKNTKPEVFNQTPQVHDTDDRSWKQRLLAAIWAAFKRFAYRHRVKLRPVWYSLAVWPLALAGAIVVALGRPGFMWSTLGVIAVCAALFGLVQVKGKRDRVYYIVGNIVCLAWIAATAYWLVDAFAWLLYAWLLMTAAFLVGWLWDHRIRTWMRLQRAGDDFEITLDIAGFGQVTQLHVDEDRDELTGKIKFVQHDLRVPRGMDRDQITAKMIEASLPAARANSVTILKPPHNRRLVSVQYVPYDPWATDKGIDKPIEHPVFNAIREINKRLTAANLHKLNGGQEIPEAFKAALPPELRRWVPAGASVSEGIPLGDRADGSPIVWIVWDAKHGTHHLLVGGQKGGGKTNLINDLVCGFAPCYNAIMWGIDTRKKGAAFVHWGRVLDWVARDPEEATFMLRAARELIETRSDRRVRERRMTDKVHPSRDEPLLIILMDEGAALTNGDHEWCSSAMKAGEEIATGGRSECITEAFVTQRPTTDSVCGTWRAQMDDRMSFRNSNKGEGRFTLNAWDDLDTSALEHDGMFFAEFGLKSADARLCRAYKFCEPEQIAKIARYYESFRPQLNAEDTATVMRIAGQFYARRFDWLDPNYVPPKPVDPDELLNTTPVNQTKTGAPIIMTKPPAEESRMFSQITPAQRDAAAVPKSLIDTDPVVGAAARRHADTLNTVIEEIADTLTPCPPGAPLEELVKLNSDYREPVNMNDEMTIRIWKILLNRGEQGIQKLELKMLANTSESTVLRRLTMMADAQPPMVYHVGETRARRYYAVLDHPYAQQMLADA